ncbi:MAG: hypothetical protein OXI23_06600, partial [Gemmatimonadota bacterium]|nr:hypothetical protein [Gemmatimonadota bacterium]
PLAMYTGLKDYMVSFQLNPNIADQADASIEDARNAYRIADDYLKGYDKLLGVSDITLDPNIVFKVGGGHEAARKITTVLNSAGIGTNNTVVYTVVQEVQLVIDAFEGKARAAQAGKQVVRTYETNMGGRFVSHLREVEAEKLFGALSEDRAGELLAELASDLEVDIPEGTLAEQVAEICSYAHLKSLDHPVVLKVAEAAGQSSEAIVQLEADLKKAGTVVARRVHWIFYAPENRPKWVAYLSDTYGLSEDQAQWILASMDVLPASKRVPDDTLHALGENMCHTEFPNHQRAVQLVSEEPDFDLDELRGSIGHEYEPGVAQRLYELPDFQKGYDLTPALKDFLENDVQIDLSGWQTRGMEPGDWPEFGSVQKTTTEFKAAYDAFLVRCVELAKEVAG